MPNGSHSAAQSRADDAQRSAGSLREELKELRRRVERLEKEIKELKQNPNDPRA